MDRELWIICESERDGVSGASAELLTKGAELAETAGFELVAVYFGTEKRLPVYPAEKAYVLSDNTKTADHQGRALAAAARRCQPKIILAPASSWGRALLAIAAAELGAGLTADCTALDICADGALLQIRPAFGGMLIAENVCRSGHLQMATVRPGSFLPSLGAGIRMGKDYIQMSDLTAFKGSTKLDEIFCEDNRSKLMESKIIVSAGMGVGSKEGFACIKELAAAVGGVLGASRAAVNAGLAPYACQVGQSGSIVRPDIYIAIGISGAVQHLAGIQTAGKIIAVNTDAKAPIFGFADLGICADWRDFTQALLRKI